MKRHGGRIAMPAVVLAALLFGNAGSGALAQTYPSHQMKAITNVSAGGTYDIFMRAIGEELLKLWGQPLVIEPRPGGNYIIAGRACAESAADGYTMCALTGETLVLNEFIFKKIPYDPRKDFTPVMDLLFNTQVLVVNSSLNVKTLDELAALAKAKLKTLAYVAPGMFQRVFFDRFNKQHGVDLVGVPFKGGGEALNGILSGTTPIAFFGGANFAQYVQDGKMVALAVDADKRSPLFPDTPTLRELGFKDKFSRAYLTLVMPAQTPNDIVLKLNRSIADIMNRPDFRKTHIATRGLEAIADSPEEARRFLEEDREIVGGLVKEAGLVPE